MEEKRILEYEYLVHLVRCGLRGEMPRKEDVDLLSVYNLARKHEVANIAYLAISKAIWVDKNIVALFKSSFFSAIKRDNLQNQYYQELISLLHQNNIKTIEVQGTVVKKYYSSSDMRLMSDIDFIIQKQDLELATNLLLEKGFSISYRNENESSLVIENKIGVEFHTEFFDDETINNGILYREVLSLPFSKAKSDDGLTFFVDEQTFYLYNILHTLKHFLNRGAGIRRIMDMYVLTEKVKSNKTEIDNALTKLGLLEEKEKMFSIAYSWFGENETKPNIEDVEEIFLSGTHGNESLFLRREIKKQKQSGKKCVKLRLIMRKFFPTKQTVYRFYPFTKKHNYPIVLCWLHRFVINVFNPVKWFKLIKKILRISKNKN